jgi:F0F1-type ATP synthase membrane subunit c/vacuolar-type H+-ATPase subunit K
MLREIGAVLAGYIVMAVTVFATFSVAYILMGSEGAYLPGVYDVTSLWIGVTLVLGLIAAIIGGNVCVRIARNPRTPKALAALVLILGIISAIFVMVESDKERPTVRVGDVPLMESVNVAKQPLWVAFLNPLIGVAGVMIGARCGAKKNA